ncbi:MAG: cell division protease FtsH, partial [Actinomycetota bacterium]|nr:cell division protease FtsH [Actinomycetota bacterium]
MSPGPEDQWRPPEPPPGRSPRPGGPGGSPLKAGNRPKWMPWVIIGLIVVGFLVWRAAPPSSTSTTKVDYGDFRTLVAQDHVSSIKYDASSGKITGQFKDGFTRDGKKEFTTQGQINQLPDADITLLNQHNVARNYKPRSSDIVGTLLVYLLPLVLIGGIWFFIARRA